jgi:hypothetical protein
MTVAGFSSSDGRSGGPRPATMLGLLAQARHGEPDAIPKPLGGALRGCSPECLECRPAGLANTVPLRGTI